MCDQMDEHIIQTKPNLSCGLCPQMTTVLNNITIVIFFIKVTKVCMVAIETVVHGHNDY